VLSCVRHCIALHCIAPILTDSLAHSLTPVHLGFLPPIYLADVRIYLCVEGGVTCLCLGTLQAGRLAGWLVPSPTHQSVHWLTNSFCSIATVARLTDRWRELSRPSPTHREERERGVGAVDGWSWGRLSVCVCVCVCVSMCHGGCACVVERAMAATSAFKSSWRCRCMRCRCVSVLTDRQERYIHVTDIHV